MPPYARALSLMNEGQFDGYQLLQRARNKGASQSGLWPRAHLGFEVLDYKILSHGGSTVGFTADSYLNPITRLGYIRLSNINAILDYTSTEWRDVDKVTDEIRTLVMTKIRILPTIDLVVPFFVLVSLGGIITILRAWFSRRK